MDPDLADDYINHPDQLEEAAEEALRLYDLPVDVSPGRPTCASSASRSPRRSGTSAPNT